MQASAYHNWRKRFCTKKLRIEKQLWREDRAPDFRKSKLFMNSRFLSYLIDIIFGLEFIFYKYLIFDFFLSCVYLQFVSVLLFFFFCCLFASSKSFNSNSRWALCTFFSVVYVWFSASITFEIIICYSLFCTSFTLWCVRNWFEPYSNFAFLYRLDEPNFYNFFFASCFWQLVSFLQRKLLLNIYAYNGFQVFIVNSITITHCHASSFICSILSVKYRLQHVFFTLFFRLCVKNCEFLFFFFFTLWFYWFSPKFFFYNCDHAKNGFLNWP